jgi:hypothetical protein
MRRVLSLLKVRRYLVLPLYFFFRDSSLISSSLVTSFLTLSCPVILVVLLTSLSKVSLGKVRVLFFTLRVLVEGYSSPTYSSSISSLLLLLALARFLLIITSLKEDLSRNTRNNSPLYLPYTRILDFLKVISTLISSSFLSLLIYSINAFFLAS